MKILVSLVDNVNKNNCYLIIVDSNTKLPMLLLSVMVIYSDEKLVKESVHVISPHYIVNLMLRLNI